MRKRVLDDGSSDAYLSRKGTIENARNTNEDGVSASGETMTNSRRIRSLPSRNSTSQDETGYGHLNGHVNGHVNGDAESIDKHPETQTRENEGLNGGTEADINPPAFGDPEEERLQGEAKAIISEDEVNRPDDAGEGETFNEEEKILRKDFERVKAIVDKKKRRLKSGRRKAPPAVDKDRSTLLKGNSQTHPRSDMEDGEGVLQGESTGDEVVGDDNPTDDGHDRGEEAEEAEDDEEDEEEDDAAHQVELDLLKQLMNRMIQLEAEARQMLLDSMDKGIARTLLLADRNGESLLIHHNLIGIHSTVMRSELCSDPRRGKRYSDSALAKLNSTSSGCPSYQRGRCQYDRDLAGGRGEDE